MNGAQTKCIDTCDNDIPNLLSANEKRCLYNCWESDN